MHALYAGAFLVFFAVFQFFVQGPDTGSDWGRYSVEVVVKAAFLHTVFWIILIRPAAASWRRIVSAFADTGQVERLNREVTAIAVLDKRIQRLEVELKRREAERSGPG